MPKKTIVADSMLLKPCDSMLLKQRDTLSAAADSMLLKPCDTQMLLKPCDSMLLKPCDTLSRKSAKQQQPMEMEMEMETNVVPPIITINKGEHIDLKAFLSSKDRDYLVSPLNGERFPISCLDANYVLVCPFLLPYPDYSCTLSTCQALQSLYSELTRLAFHPIFKLVVVLKLHPSLDQSAFHSFFSRLSLDCLAVPFSDQVASHSICLSLGLPPNSSPYFDDLYCLAVHPNGIVLRRDLSFLNKYGPLSFPFTDDHFLDIRRQDTLIELKLRSSKLTLKGLLKCDWLSRITSDSDPVSVSALDKTTVGIYLYIHGYSMDLIQDIHKKCILKGHKFEIVLVPVPFQRREDPAVFCNLMKKSALGNSNSTSSSWLLYPYNDKLCRALWRLARCDMEDQLIILPPGNCPGDVYGKQVSFRYGIDAYPFTRDVIVRRKFTELRSLTPESLLGDIFVPDVDLHNKNVVLYIDDPKSYYGSRDYEEILDKYPGTVVIFTPLDFGVGNFQDIGWSKIPREVSYGVIERIFPEPGATFDQPTLVTFGKDGKILSRQAQLRLPRRKTSSGSIFDDKLRHEIEHYLTVEMMAESCEEK